jgi:hypothetical protein
MSVLQLSEQGAPGVSIVNAAERESRPKSQAS